MPSKIKFFRSSVDGKFEPVKDSRTKKSDWVMVKHDAKLEPRTVQIRGNVSSVSLYTSYIKGKTVASPSTKTRIDAGTGKKEG